MNPCTNYRLSNTLCGDLEEKFVKEYCMNLTSKVVLGLAS